ncbi:MAG TPA: hypothetical protein VIS96_18275 [Terrimicrobiaceae bacterium]
MKTLATTLSAAVLMVSFSSCSWLKEKYSKNDSASAAYLSEKKSARATTNLEGLWYSPQWGIVVFNQERGGKLNGIFRDHYVVNGVVSSKSAFLTLIDDDWVEYTVELKRKNREELVGFYSPSVPFSEKDAHELVLKRIGD